MSPTKAMSTLNAIIGILKRYNINSRKNLKIIKKPIGDRLLLFKTGCTIIHKIKLGLKCSQAAGTTDKLSLMLL